MGVFISEICTLRLNVKRELTWPHFACLVPSVIIMASISCITNRIKMKNPLNNICFLKHKFSFDLKIIYYKEIKLKSSMTWETWPVFFLSVFDSLVHQLFHFVFQYCQCLWEISWNPILNTLRILKLVYLLRTQTERNTFVVRVPNAKEYFDFELEDSMSSTGTSGFFLFLL